MLTARIDQLEPGDRLLIRYASVVGPTFALDVLTEILAGEPVEPSDLERWKRLSEFVEWASSELLRFIHDLFRAMAYEGLSYRRRREIHGRVALALEARAGENVEDAAGLLSLHFLAAGKHQEAWRYAVVAGRRAPVDVRQRRRRGDLRARALRRGAAPRRCRRPRSPPSGSRSAT